MLAAPRADDDDSLSAREVQELLSAGTDADEADRHADLRLEEVDVVERLAGQLVRSVMVDRSVFQPGTSRRPA